MNRFIAILKRLALRVASVAIDEAIDGALEEVREDIAGRNLTPKELASTEAAILILAEKLKARF